MKHIWGKGLWRLIWMQFFRATSAAILPAMHFPKAWENNLILAWHSGLYYRRDMWLAGRQVWCSLVVL